MEATKLKGKEKFLELTKTQKLTCPRELSGLTSED